LPSGNPATPTGIANINSTVTTPFTLRVIPRDQHTISRKDVSPNALRVLYRLREAGFGAYLVGGAVRDLLVGGRPKDFDVATDATPEQIKQLFRNCRLIGRRFRLAHVVFGREIIEVATFRANIDDGSGDREVENGMLVRDNVYGSIEDDAVRRDFTCNALYYAIEDFSVRDYVGGFEDVLARRMKLIGDPEQRYREDPVRMLRAVRLAAKLDFGIEPATAEPIPRLAGLLEEAAPARLFEEVLKLFLSGHGVASFEGLERHGLLPALFPESAAALKSNRSGALRRFVIEGLRSTDERVANDEPVSPAFLFALLLWPAFCRTLIALQRQGLAPEEAQRRAADRVTLHQLTTIALPRRFSLPMQEIWLLQSRFASRQRKRVFRTLTHPRFRAAFDFLVLRQAASSEHAADIAFWREAQQQSGRELESSLDSLHAEGAAEEGAAPRRRRRRRRSSSARVLGPSRAGNRRRRHRPRCARTCPARSCANCSPKRPATACSPPRPPAARRRRPWPGASSKPASATTSSSPRAKTPTPWRWASTATVKAPNVVSPPWWRRASRRGSSATGSRPPPAGGWTWPMPTPPARRICTSAAARRSGRRWSARACARMPPGRTAGAPRGPLPL